MKKFLTFIMSLCTTFAAQGKDIDISNSKVLVVYFSKTGEQYSVGNITEGNTAIVAKMIAEQTGDSLFEMPTYSYLKTGEIIGRGTELSKKFKQ